MTQKISFVAGLAVAFALVAAPAGAGAAPGAAQKRPGPKPGGVVTRSTTVQLPPKTLGTAVAVCPAKMKAVGGGFLAAPGGAEQTLVTESRRAGRRSWIVRGVRASALTTTSGTLTATVQCRSGAPRMRVATASTTLPAATQAGAVVSGAATATCRGRGRSALAGGFAAEWDPSTVLGAIPQESRRVAKGRAWRFGASHGNQVAQRITSFAYCAKGSARTSQATASLAGDLATRSAEARGCGRPGRPLAGGFIASQASLLAGGNVVFVLGSQPQGRAWRTTGLHAGPTSVGSLRSFLYCG